MNSKEKLQALAAFGERLKNGSAKMEGEALREFEKDLLASIELANPKLATTHDMQLGLMLIKCGVDLMFRAACMATSTLEDAEIAGEYVQQLAKAQVDRELEEAAMHVLKQQLGLEL